MNTLRVQVVKTDRTDLVCIYCGEFGARRPMLALVGPTVASSDAVAGVHVKCVPLIKATSRRATRKTAAVVPLSDIPPAFRADNEDHDRALCECGECENARAASRSHTDPAPPPEHCDDEVPDGMV